MKIALAAVPEYALKNFSECTQWVRYNEKPKSFDSKLLKMYMTMVPDINPFRDIWLQIYKRTGDKKIPLHDLCVSIF